MNINEVIKIVEKVFECKPGTISENTTLLMLKNWDSLGQFQLIDHLDENYNGITKKNKNLTTASSVKELYEMGLKKFRQCLLSLY